MKNTSFCLVALLGCVMAASAVEFASPFGDNMVLQRQMPVPVWGFAEPNEQVTVSFAGQTKTAQANKDGDWRVTLDPLTTSTEERPLIAKGAKGEARVNGVLVGEVWLCAGQSNMGVALIGDNTRCRDRQGAMISQMIHRPLVRMTLTDTETFGPDPKKRTRDKRFWTSMIPEHMKYYGFSAVGAYFGIDLAGELPGVPIGLVGVYRGATGISCWTPHEAMAARADLQDLANWKYIDTKDWKKSDIKGTIDQPCMQPSVYWNTVVAPWAPFACRGMIWYQGEHNTSEANRYLSKLHALYDGWSKAFENPNLKFYYVQICPCYGIEAPLQEEMAKFELEQPNAAMAIVNDIGNLWDVHPNEKALVGHRLALHALKCDYGYTDIEDNSPRVKSMTVVSNTVELALDHAKKAYVYKMDQTFDLPFEVAGEDGMWHKAELMNLNVTPAWGGGTERKGDLKPGDKIILASPEVAKPVKARYLHIKPNIGYLFNEVNLPLGAFEVSK